MKNIGLFILLLLCCKMSIGQSFEKLLATDGDTTLIGIQAIPTQDGFVILGFYYAYNFTTNDCTGNCLFWTDEQGDPYKMRTYTTGIDSAKGCQWDFYSCHEDPTFSMLINQENEIILPVATYFGRDPCTISSRVVRNAVMHKLNFGSGDIVLSQMLDYDTLLQCGNEVIIADIRENEDGTYDLLLGDERNDAYLLYQVSSDFEFTFKCSIPQSYVPTSNILGNIIDRDSNYLWLTAKEPYILEQYDFSGNLVRNFPNHPEITSGRPTIKFYEDKIILMQIGQFFDSITWSYTVVSTIQVFNRSGDIYAHKSYWGKAFSDIDIMPDGKILILEDLSKFDQFDTMPKPVKVYLETLELENISSSIDLGFPLITTTQIKAISDTEFIMTGFKKPRWYNGATEKGKIYFAKQSLNDLISSTHQETASDQMYDIIPNPNDGHFRVEYKGSYAAVANKPNVQVYDVIGKLLINTVLEKSSNNFDLQAYPSGMYFIRIFSQERVSFSGKIMKI